MNARMPTAFAALDAPPGEGEFPAAEFTIEDDPAALRASLQPYRAMAQRAQATRDVLAATKVDSWKGTEGDLFRTRRAAYEPMMDAAVRGFTAFTTQVETFADILTRLKNSMDALRPRAEQAWRQLQAAKAAAAAAQADAQSRGAVIGLYSGLDSTSSASAAEAVGQAIRRAGEAARAASAAQAAAQAQWEQCQAEAKRLHDQLRAAAATTAGTVRGLEAPPVAPAPPGGLPGAITAVATGRAQVFTPRPPKPVEQMTSQEVRRWWGGLSPAQRGAVARTDPQRYGNLAGIPTEDRDWINRETLLQEREAGEAMFAAKGMRAPRTAEELKSLSEQDLVKLGVMRERVSETEGIVRYTISEQAPRLERFAGALEVSEHLGVHAGESSYLYTYEPGEYEGRGRTAISIGDPEKADRLAVMVPGMTSRTASMGSMVTDSRRVRESARRMEPRKTTATLIWQGYDAPQADELSVVGERKADAGAQLLARDVAHLHEARGRKSRPSVVAHSYGSTTAGLAAQRYGLHESIDNLVLIGSPGAGRGSDTVQDLHLRKDQVFVGSGRRDPVTGVGWLAHAHGEDPADARFGATRFKAESEWRGSLPNIDAHSQYLYDGGVSDSRTAIASVITGHSDELGEKGLVAEPRIHQPRSDYFPAKQVAP